MLFQVLLQVPAGSKAFYRCWVHSAKNMPSLRSALFTSGPSLLCSLCHLYSLRCFCKPCFHQSNTFQPALCGPLTGSQAFEVSGEFVRVVRAVGVTIALPLDNEQAAAIGAAELIWPTRAVRCTRERTVSPLTHSPFTV